MNCKSPIFPGKARASSSSTGVRRRPACGPRLHGPASSRVTSRTLRRAAPRPPRCLGGPPAPPRGLTRPAATAHASRQRSRWVSIRHWLGALLSTCVTRGPRWLRAPARSHAECAPSAPLTGLLPLWATTGAAAALRPPRSRIGCVYTSAPSSHAPRPLWCGHSHSRPPASAFVYLSCPISVPTPLPRFGRLRRLLPFVHHHLALHSAPCLCDSAPFLLLAVAA